jgi:hypothetical protein
VAQQAFSAASKANADSEPDVVAVDDVISKRREYSVHNDVTTDTFQPVHEETIVSRRTTVSRAVTDSKIRHR